MNGDPVTATDLPDGAEPGPRRERGGKNSSLADVVVTGLEQLRRETAEAQGAGGAPVASEPPTACGSKSLRSRPCHRTRSAREKPQHSAAPLFIVAAAVTYAVLTYAQCYATLRSGGVDSGKRPPWPPRLRAGSAVRMLAGSAWGGEDLCSHPFIGEIAQHAFKGEEGEVLSGARRNGGGPEGDDTDLEEAQKAELERLKSFLPGEEEGSSKAPARFWSYHNKSVESKARYELGQVCRLSLIHEAELSQLLAEADAVARRAGELHAEEQSSSTSAPGQSEKVALALRARELVIRMNLAAEKIGWAERRSRRLNERIDLTDLPLIAEATFSWPLPEPSDPLSMHALVNASTLLFRARRALNWAERSLRHTESITGPVWPSPLRYSARQLRVQEVKALADLLRRAIPGLTRRRDAWRAVARNHGFKVMELAPGEYPETKAFALINQMSARLASAGLDARLESVVRDGGLDLQSLYLCREVIERWRARSLRRMSEARVARLYTELLRAKHELKEINRMLRSVLVQIQDAEARQ